jgi:hypothetical protein
MDFLRIKKLLDRISVILSAMVMRQEVVGASMAIEPFVSEKSRLRRIELIQQRIDHLRTPEELQAVLRILQKHIP